MALHHGLFTLALSALLLAPVASEAAPHDAVPVGPPRMEMRRDERRAPPPPMPARPRGASPHGRYELQTVERHVSGRYEQVWVDRVCTWERRGRVERCVPGHYEQQWVPGYTQLVQEWVWVPRYSRYGRG